MLAELLMMALLFCILYIVYRRWTYWEGTWFSPKRRIQISKVPAQNPVICNIKSIFDACELISVNGVLYGIYGHQAYKVITKVLNGRSHLYFTDVPVAAIKNFTLQFEKDNELLIGPEEVFIKIDISI